MKRSRRVLHEAHHPETLRRESLLEAMRNLDTNVLVRYITDDEHRVTEQRLNWPQPS